MRKKVLVVCMINSVHAAKWLKQFEDCEIDFYIFPSAFFEKPHPLISRLISSSSQATYTIQYTPSMSGYFDYFQDRVLRFISPFFSRKNRLHRFIGKVNPEIIHALEFQHSAYLCSEVIDSFGKKFEYIATNWGSDIYYFMNIAQHNVKIRKVLAQADKYSAECARDIHLASQMGFKGKFLPIIPNAGGFPPDMLFNHRSIASNRKLIIVKGYGGYFGRVEFVAKALDSLLMDFPDYSVFFYSVTDDALPAINNLKRHFGLRISFSTVRLPLSHESIQNKFDLARIYIGCSVSDGVSTSFLESLVAGSYPIQTSTSCANEWIEKGAVASLVSLDKEEISKALRFALESDTLVDSAQLKNMKVSREFLDQRNILKQALTFYS